MAGIDVLADNAATNLAADVTTTPAAGTVETWAVNDTTPFPQIGTAGVQQFRCTVGDDTDPDPEIVVCTQIPGAASMQVERGAEGSPVKIHAAGDPIVNTITRGGLDGRFGLPASAEPTKLAAFFGLPFTAFGHSFLNPGGYLDTGVTTKYISRLADALRTVPAAGTASGWGDLTNNAVSGSMMTDVACGMIYGTAGQGGSIAAGYTGLVWIDAMTNDVGWQAYAGAAQAGFNYALESAILYARRGSEYPVTDASIAYTGTWASTNFAGTFWKGAAARSNTVGATATITVPAGATEIDLVMIALQVANDVEWTISGPNITTFVYNQQSTMVPTQNNSGQTYSPAVIALRGLTPGQTVTVQLTKCAGGYGWFNGYFTPSAAPPLVVVCKDPPQNAAVTSEPQYSEANRQSYASAIDTVVGKIPTAGTAGIKVIDLAQTPGWDPATTADANGIHPTDYGHALIARYLLSELSGQPFVSGLTKP